MRKAKKLESPKENPRPCDVQGCAAAGEYKAPKSRHHLRDYYWFCLDHVREYNKAWDYFSGWNGGEIEAFMKDAVTGHRPTWKINESDRPMTADMLEEGLFRFFEELRSTNKKKSTMERQLDVKQRRALSVFDMDHPTTHKAIKTRYKVLVKKHHPDVNKGNPQSEELFKKVTEAYKYLMTHYKES